ncbi:MAG: DUF695 domain-containing protein [Archangium sp.]
MSKRWTENFDFYEARATKGRALVSLDLAAAEHSPVESHPLRVQVRVKMLAPREDGLRSSEEADALFALEDTLVAAAHEKLDAIYVARAVAYGYSEFYFYVPAARQSAVPALLWDAAPYAFEWQAESDPSWERYEQLFPDKFSYQHMMNRRVLQQLEAAGDDLKRTREVDHFAYFPSEAQAKAAGELLTKAGFRVDEPGKPETEGYDWSLGFHRDDSLAEGEADELVDEVLELLEPHDGDYDGWGCGVQKKELMN